ncbi:hypothetical protein QQF64_025729 [Cirrhinus molitorella]|uniref:Tyr recombinase domain-containing protein n=1 Tax=Cirrhinus molitorella TaxID=172907 RepID=A0ABR3NPW0_9TELE
MPHGRAVGYHCWVLRHGYPATPAGLSHACLGPGRCSAKYTASSAPEEADPALVLLCPVRALRVYVDRNRSFRRSKQLFVCFGGRQKGNAVPKQRLARWVVDAITSAYETKVSRSTRSVASSYALAHGASLAVICSAAGWATPNTFVRFYNLRVEPVSSRVLT